MPNTTKHNDSGRSAPKLPPSALAAAALSTTLTGCQAIEGIFKAGFWVGTLAVIGVITLAVLLIARLVR